MKNLKLLLMGLLICGAVFMSACSSSNQVNVAENVNTGTEVIMNETTVIETVAETTRQVETTARQIETTAETIEQATEQAVLAQQNINNEVNVENEMSTKLNTYNVMNTQLQAARAKLQERIPSFTILNGASVPVKPTGPKRVVFIFAMLVLATVATAFFVYRKEILRQFTVKRSVAVVSQAN